MTDYFLWQLDPDKEDRLFIVEALHVTIFEPPKVIILVCIEGNPGDVLTAKTVFTDFFLGPADMPSPDEVHTSCMFQN